MEDIFSSTFAIHFEFNVHAALFKHGCYSAIIYGFVILFS